jgi:hypothetical protein
MPLMCIAQLSVDQDVVSVRGPVLGTIPEFVCRHRKQAWIVGVPAQIRSSPFSNISQKV